MTEQTLHTLKQVRDDIEAIKDSLLEIEEAEREEYDNLSDEEIAEDKDVEINSNLDTLSDVIYDLEYDALGYMDDTISDAEDILISQRAVIEARRMLADLPGIPSEEEAAAMEEAAASSVGTFLAGLGLGFLLGGKKKKKEGPWYE